MWGWKAAFDVRWSFFFLKKKNGTVDGCGGGWYFDWGISKEVCGFLGGVLFVGSLFFGRYELINLRCILFELCVRCIMSRCTRVG